MAAFTQKSIFEKMCPGNLCAFCNRHFISHQTWFDHLGNYRCTGDITDDILWERLKEGEIVYLIYNTNPTMRLLRAFNMPFNQQAIFTKLCPEKRCIFCNKQFKDYPTVHTSWFTHIRKKYCPGIMTIFQLQQRLTNDECDYVIDKWFPELRPAVDKLNNVVDIQVDVEADQVPLEGDVADELENAVGDEPEGAVVDEPEGAVVDEPEGAVVDEPEGAVVDEPEGAVVDEPEGAVVDEPEGAVVDEPEGAVVDEPEGAVGVVKGNFGTTDTVNGVGTGNRDAELEKDQPEKMKPEETAGALDIVIKGLENLLNEEE